MRGGLGGNRAEASIRTARRSRLTSLWRLRFRHCRTLMSMDRLKKMLKKRRLESKEQNPGLKPIKFIALFVGLKPHASTEKLQQRLCQHALKN